MTRILVASYKTCASLSVVDIETGAETRTIETPRGPTWITQAPSAAHILVVCSTDILTLDNNLNITSTIGTSGKRQVHGCWSREEDHVLIVDYDAGTVEVYPFVDHQLRPAACIHHFHGHGSYEPLQASSHPHQVIPGPDKRYYIADLGLDCVHAINMGSNGAIKHVESYSVHSVSGPRHIAFHPTTQTVYVLGEIGLTVTTMELASDGALRRVGHPLSIAPKGHSSKAGLNNELGERGLMASAIQISQSANQLYLSIRSAPNANADSIVTCELGSSYPYTPSNCRLDPSGRLLVSCNQSSRSLAVFHVTADTGALRWSKDIGLSSGILPTAIVWL